MSLGCRFFCTVQDFEMLLCMSSSRIGPLMCNYLAAFYTVMISCTLACGEMSYAQLEFALIQPVELARL